MLSILFFLPTDSLLCQKNQTEYKGDILTICKILEICKSELAGALAAYVPNNDEIQEEALWKWYFKLEFKNKKSY